MAYSVITDAQKHRFEEALELDPNFGPAQNALGLAEDLLGAADTPLQEVAQRGGQEVAEELRLAGTVSGGELAARPGGGETPEQIAAQLDDRTNTLANVAEGVDPTPTTGTIDRASPAADQPGEVPAEQEQQQAQQAARQPVPESRDQDQPTGGSQATVHITIQRPGGN